MRYSLEETIYIVEEFVTGDTVTIALYKLSDSSTVTITSNSCLEIGSTGNFKWDTSNITTQPTSLTEYLWIMSNGATTISGQIIMGGYPDDISYIDKWIHIDTEASINGNGKSSSPFNVIADAVDFAESVGWYRLLFLSDATLERKLKGFTIEGIGLPTIDFNGQDVDRSEFLKVKLTGQQIGTITSREVLLLPGISNLNGIYKECGIGTGGTYTIAEGAIASFTSASSLLISITPTPPKFDLGAATTSAILSMRKYSGGVELINVNTSTKLVTAQFEGGQMILDSTCDNGIIKIAGLPASAVTDNSVGSTVVTAGNLPSTASIWAYEK